MYIVAFVFLAWAWFGVKKKSPRYIIPLIAVVSALLLVVQLFNFPVAGGGSTWHFLGGTAISMILGPFACIISMTITLIIQALALGDGGITTFGANLFSMTVIGAMSFFLVKSFLSRGFTTRRLVLGVFVASVISNVCTALAVGLKIGLFPMVGTLGGIFVTVPRCLFGTFHRHYRGDCCLFFDSFFIAVAWCEAFGFRALQKTQHKVLQFSLFFQTAEPSHCKWNHHFLFI